MNARGVLLPRHWLTDNRLDSLAEEATRRKAAGEPAIPFQLENATSGLGTRKSQRGFGVELEFALPPAAARHQPQGEAVARELYDTGLGAAEARQDSSSGTQRQHARGWQFVEDVTLISGGEVVSPLMFDEPDTWKNLGTVLGVLDAQGATVTPDVGTHVHVGTDDLGSDLGLYEQLLTFFRRYAPELYALAANLEDGKHRVEKGNVWCAPNRVIAGEFETPDALHDAWLGHGAKIHALNFASACRPTDNHVEFRLWDGSLDPGVIQTRIKLSLAMAAWAANPSVGPHINSPAKPTGVKPDVARLERMLSELFTNEEDRLQAATLFALVQRANHR